MKVLFVQLVPMFIFYTMLAVFSGLMYWWRSSRLDRRSPLTRRLLRGPGYSLMKRIEALDDDIEVHTVSLISIPVFIYASYTSLYYFGVPDRGRLTPYLYALLGLASVVILSVRLVRRLKERGNHQLGLDCEMAVGQELNTLMREGYRVFHDITGEEFNVDHVVVGPKGVFAVETKGRSKPNRGRGKEDAKVVYDGESLTFPDRVEAEPLAQAKRQATWLAKWLTDAVGEPVSVQPVLALPGWFIERKKWGGVFLLNGTEYHALVTQKISTPLSDVMVQRISHQLEQRCRDVEPTAYHNRRKRNHERQRKTA